MPSFPSGVKRFFTKFALPLLAILALCAALTAFLIASGEYEDLYEIIDRQERTGGYYDSTLLQRVFDYKKHLFLEKKPEVAVLGSSRMLQFRQDDFSVPFVNLGGMGSLDETIEIVNDLLPFHQPAIVILGIDFWWFHPSSEKTVVKRSPEDIYPSPKDILSLLADLARGKMTPSQIIDISKGKPPHIGLAAQTRGEGYSTDGAYHHTATLTGLEHAGDIRFSKSLKEIKGGNGVYAHGSDISEQQWQKFLQFLQKMQEAGLHPVLLLPPLAPAVQGAMDESGKYGYIEKLRRKISERAAAEKIPFFDNHNAQSLGGNDCEFIDGLHGGAVIYNRVLLQMAITEDGVRDRIPLAKIGWNIEKFGGRASMTKGETDFLDIGCDKQGAAP